MAPTGWGRRIWGDLGAVTEIAGHSMEDFSPTGLQNGFPQSVRQRRKFYSATSRTHRKPTVPALSKLSLIRNAVLCKARLRACG